MADIEGTSTSHVVHDEHKYASNAKGNAGLTLGIIGTALGGLATLGGAGALLGKGVTTNGTMSDVERRESNDKLELTKEMYENKISSTRELTNAFFDAYKRDIDNSFMLYKNQRDMFDVVNKEQHDNYDALNQKIIDTSFGLYKNQRDEKDVLNEKIGALQAKIDVMSAVRPYQDALINARIDKNALISDFNLYRRTCKMIEGQLVLPSTPVVSGYGSYNPITYVQTT